MVTHKVKGGLSVDVGIPAFLPGSQIDLQRVMDFDQYVGQTITANILKLNQKHGNIIISRRKYLSEQRSEVRNRSWIRSKRAKLFKVKSKILPIMGYLLILAVLMAYCILLI